MFAFCPFTLNCLSVYFLRIRTVRYIIIHNTTIKFRKCNRDIEYCFLIHSPYFNFVSYLNNALHSHLHSLTSAPALPLPRSPITFSYRVGLVSFNLEHFQPFSVIVDLNIFKEFRPIILKNMISCHSLFTSCYFTVKKGFLFSSIYISMNADSYSSHWVIIHCYSFDVQMMSHLPGGRFFKPVLVSLGHVTSFLDHDLTLLYSKMFTPTTKAPPLVRCTVLTS